MQRTTQSRSLYIRAGKHKRAVRQRRRWLSPNAGLSSACITALHHRAVSVSGAASGAASRACVERCSMRLVTRASSRASSRAASMRCIRKATCRRARAVSPANRASMTWRPPPAAAPGPPRSQTSHNASSAGGRATASCESCCRRRRPSRTSTSDWAARPGATWRVPRRWAREAPSD